MEKNKEKNCTDEHQVTREVYTEVIMKKWITTKRERIYKGRIFSICDLECYHPVKDVSHNFFIAQTYDWINVVAKTKDEKYIFVKQHRLGTDEITLETAGGIIEEGENPEDCALRELEEETGFKPEKIHFLKKMSANPAIMNNYIYFYFAEGCEKVSEQKLDKTEYIEIELLDDDTLLSHISLGIINNTIVMNALGLYFLSKHFKGQIEL